MVEFTNPSDMQEFSKKLILEGKTIGFVPTMGALHEGHLSLIKRSKEENHYTVVSIFVNPIQFGPKEDLNSYPRDLEGDREKLQSLGVDALFLPTPDNMYPEGFKTYVTVEGLSERLCGAFRPGHFRGVATVVLKLFNIVKPTRAYFGLKDFQQTLIIKTMVRDLNLDVQIVPCPTVREPDGLAMSSRNQYLTEEERKGANFIYRALKETEEVLKGGGSFKEASETLKLRLKASPHVKELQYASVYDPHSLDDLSDVDVNIYNKSEVVLAVALIYGKARLIDNLIVKIKP
ncbi:MAG: pantoate--beta-alanine ligase [Nitrospirae bacterium]|nr:MAG: pantoate--beta-alanine ligase [Nitrospirota bacterium]